MSRRWWLVLGWTVVILGLCWTPRSAMPDPNETSRLLIQLPVDKVVHFGMFFGFALLFGLASRKLGWTRHRDTIAVAVVVAIVSELGQLMPFVNRDAGLDDLLADTLGAGVGSLLVPLAGRYLPTKAPSSETP